MTTALNLPPATQQAVHALYLQAFSIRKTAAALGLSKDKVERTLGREKVLHSIALSKKQVDLNLDTIIALSSERLVELLHDTHAKLTPLMLNTVMGTAWDKRYKDSEPIKSQNVIFNLFGSVHSGLSQSLKLLPPGVKQLLEQRPSTATHTKTNTPTPTLVEESHDEGVEVMCTDIQGQESKEENEE